MAKLPAIVSAVVSDPIGLFIPGGATASTLLMGYFERRHEQAREIVLAEMRAGNIDQTEAASEDDAIAITLMILKAARDGRARINLRLLAKAFVGLARRDFLAADELLAHADIPASLSRDEIIVIATVYRYYLMGNDQNRNRGDYWLLAKGNLAKHEMELEDRVQAVAGRAQRSGLVAAVSAFDAVAYRVTPLLRDLVKLVDVDDALRREGLNPRQQT